MAVDQVVSDTSLSAVLSVSHDARSLAISLLDFVSDPAQSSLSTAEAQLAISKQQKLLYAYLARLRGAHRQASFDARETKGVTAEARQEVDRLHLHLQNLFYEQRHLESEIRACVDYDHKYQSLPLIPVETFLQLFPEHVDSDEVALTVARIEHEYQEREKLEQQRQALIRRKAGLVADNKRRKEELANLDRQLEAFIDAAKPIQKTLEKVV
jgi:THO complex subunit 5